MQNALHPLVKSVMCGIERQKVAWVLVLASWGQLGCSQGDAVQPVSPSVMFGLVGTGWSLTQLDGQPAGVGAGGAAPTLLLTAADSHASGFAGCNRLTGSYQLVGDRLRFSQIATTRMFCAGGMSLEQRYLTALEATRAYRLIGRDLELVGDGRVVARFQTP